jgi:putative transcriptional regulator
MAPWSGPVLKRMRERRKLTQAELAAKIDAHVLTISRLERGVRRPSALMLQRLAKALRCRMEDLLT